ncbi:hypothetical protein KI387_016122, partial [Taxus chinensis]
GQKKEEDRAMAMAMAGRAIPTVGGMQIQPQARLGVFGSSLGGNAVPIATPTQSHRLPVLKTGSLKFSLLPIRATSSEEASTSSIDTEELFSDLKEKWDAVENKSTVLLYGGGAILAVWISSIIVGAINSVPVLPKIMELIGLGYTGWFVYRYLLFKSSRKELASDIEEIKKKITGTTE